MLEHLYFPHDISTFGPQIDWLFELIFWIVMVVWIAVMIALVVFLIRYRTRPGRKAEYIEGNTRLEIVWTTATAVILVVLAFMSRSTWAEIKEHGPPGQVFYKVDAKQFNWEITYPGPDGKFDTNRLSRSKTRCTSRSIKWRESISLRRTSSTASSCPTCGSSRTRFPAA